LNFAGIGHFCFVATCQSKVGMSASEQSRNVRSGLGVEVSRRFVGLYPFPTFALDLRSARLPLGMRAYLPAMIHSYVWRGRFLAGLLLAGVPSWTTSVVRDRFLDRSRASSRGAGGEASASVARPGRRCRSSRSNGRFGTRARGASDLGRQGDNREKRDPAMRSRLMVPACQNTVDQVPNNTLLRRRPSRALASRTVRLAPSRPARKSKAMRKGGAWPATAPRKGSWKNVWKR
jgi:hypothetical protein